MASVGQHVFQADDHAGQGPSGASGALSVHGVGLGAGLVGPHFQKGVEVLLPLDVTEVIVNELTAGRGARRQLALNCRKRTETLQTTRNYLGGT